MMVGAIFLTEIFIFFLLYFMGMPSSIHIWEWASHLGLKGKTKECRNNKLM